MRLNIIFILMFIIKTNSDETPIIRCYVPEIIFKYKNWNVCEKIMNDYMKRVETMKVSENDSNRARSKRHISEKFKCTGLVLNEEIFMNYITCLETIYYLMSDRDDGKIDSKIFDIDESNKGETYLENKDFSLSKT